MFAGDFGPVVLIIGRQGFGGGDQSHGLGLYGRAISVSVSTA
jgi:hypothetical protein